MKLYKSQATSKIRTKFTKCQYIIISLAEKVRVGLPLWGTPHPISFPYHAMAVEKVSPLLIISDMYTRP